MTWVLLGLAAGTLVSEDAACVAAGALAGQGHISRAAAVAACAAGIYFGDAGLWLAGRLFGARALKRWPAAGKWFTSRAGYLDHPGVILASRFLPGTRLPMYVAAGAVGRRPRTFFTWTLMAVLVWTPLIVLGSSQSLAFAAVILGLMYLLRRVDARRWRRLSARLARWRHWEFWPTAVVYGPVGLWILWLAIRHRGLGLIGAANPAIPEGGLAGESKSHILALLPPRWTIPSGRLEADEPGARLAALDRLLQREGWSYPLVLKPDTGERGIGVRWIAGRDGAAAYVAAQPSVIVVQPYHPGPHEAGIFYYRRPGEARGKILGITDKKFPVLVGDGRSTVEALIWSHPRYRLQGRVFAARLAGHLERVPAAGERLPLAMAGNHSQGTMFLDGSRLWTPALEARIDEIARQTPGFYVGRFDVRYANPERFRAGEDLAIVELNGVTGEPSHIYDPACSLWRGWAVLFRVWTIIFEIGAANRARGVVPSSAMRLLQVSWQHLRRTPALRIAS